MDGKDGSKTGSITSTDAHLVWLPDAGVWAKAEQLRPGMWLQTAAGTWVQITAVKRTVKHERVHNLTVDGVHSYYVLANGVPLLVHNNSCLIDDGAEERLKAIADSIKQNNVKNMRPGTVSESVGVRPSGLLVAVHTTSGTPGPIPGPLMSALTACGHAHGGCSEVSGAAKLMNLGAVPESVTTVGIRSKRIGLAWHGKRMSPCGSCERLLSALNITSRGA